MDLAGGTAAPRCCARSGTRDASADRRMGASVAAPGRLSLGGDERASGHLAQPSRTGSFAPFGARAAPSLFSLAAVPPCAGPAAHRCAGTPGAAAIAAAAWSTSEDAILGNGP